MSIKHSCKTLWQYIVDTSENSSRVFNSFKTQERLNENCGQNKNKKTSYKNMSGNYHF